MNNEAMMSLWSSGYRIETGPCKNQIISFHKSDHKLNILNGRKGVGH